MTPSYFIWYYCWAAPHVLQIVVLWAMLHRKLHRQFPAFFLYTVVEILQFATLLTISSSHLGFGDTYFRVYAAGLGLSTVFRFGVIHEVLTELFQSYPVLRRPGTWLFRAVTVALIALALTLSVGPPGNSSTTFIALIQNLDRSASLLQAGLLLALFSLSRYFDLSWRSPMFGIALGVGIVASIQLMIEAIRAGFGATGHRTLNLIAMAAYHCCVLVWLYYFMRPEPKSQLTTNQLPENNLEAWNRELEQLLQR
jgi:hypothetical protein